MLVDALPTLTMVYSSAPHVKSCATAIAPPLGRKALHIKARAKHKGATEEYPKWLRLNTLERILAKYVT